LVRWIERQVVFANSGTPAGVLTYFCRKPGVLPPANLHQPSGLKAEPKSLLAFSTTGIKGNPVFEILNPRPFIMDKAQTKRVESGARESSITTSKEMLLDAVRDAVNAEGGRRITKRKFLHDTGMGPRDIQRHFADWNETLRAAGFDFELANEPIEPKRLLLDWASVARKLKHIPTREEYEVHGEFHSRTFWNYFGPWGKMQRAFRTFAAEMPEWKDVLKLKSPSPRREVRYAKRRRSRAKKRATMKERVPRRLSGTHSRDTAPRSNGRVVCGARLEVGAFRHAPVNEQGVSMLFAIVAERLGYLIDGVRAGFPDCEARKLVGPDAWQGVNIEFEYESRNFERHGHSRKGCDIIVCWIHNWPDCPKSIEVIALSDEIKRVGSDFAKATSDKGDRAQRGDLEAGRMNLDLPATLRPPASIREAFRAGVAMRAGIRKSGKD
jgi:hypothetical protein